MSDKPASIYREITNPAHTRHEYITGIPGLKVARRNMDDLQANPGDYPIQISLKIEEEVQVRHGSLESARLSTNRLMLRHASEKQYKMILRKFPHHVIHKNKQTTGAGTGHVSDEVRQPFGKIVGTAACIPKSRTVLAIYCDVGDVGTAKDAFRRTCNKMSPPYRIVVDHGGELLVA